MIRMFCKFWDAITADAKILTHCMSKRTWDGAGQVSLAGQASYQNARCNIDAGSSPQFSKAKVVFLLAVNFPYSPHVQSCHTHQHLLMLRTLKIPNTDRHSLELESTQKYCTVIGMGSAALICINICVHIKNPKHWQPNILWSPNKNTVHTDRNG